MWGVGGSVVGCFRAQTLMMVMVVWVVGAWGGGGGGAVGSQQSSAVTRGACVSRVQVCNSWEPA